MAACNCCCGANCDEGQQGKCWCGTAPGACCSVSQYCCGGECVAACAAGQAGKCKCGTDCCTASEYCCDEYCVPACGTCGAGPCKCGSECCAEGEYCRNGTCVAGPCPCCPACSAMTGLSFTLNGSSSACSSGTHSAGDYSTECLHGAPTAEMYCEVDPENNDTTRWVVHVSGYCLIYGATPSENELCDYEYEAILAPETDCLPPEGEVTLTLVSSNEQNGGCQYLTLPPTVSITK